MRVLCLTTLPTEGAGNRLRIEQYAGPLHELGIDLEVSAFFDRRAYRVLYLPGHRISKAIGVIQGIVRRIGDSIRMWRYDLVVIYRESAPLGPPVLERLLSRQKRAYVYDFDDAIFLGPIHPANKGWAWLRPASRVPETATKAAAITTANEYLADWARKLNPNVTIISTPVDARRFRPVLRKTNSRLVIGWVGSSTTAPYLRLLDEPLRILSTQLDFVFRVIGGSYGHPTARVELRPFRLESEMDDLADLDIGVLPEPDDLWTRGKGAFKALLYMAMGQPVVASKVGVNEQVIDGAGICVVSAEQWVDAILRLAGDEDLRRRLGAIGRTRVESLYGLHIQAPKLAAVLLGAAAAARAGQH
jgi:glycosyltransferase involved in cell wall biosynthesis